MADLISVSIFAIMIPLLGIFGISLTPQTSVEFQKVTNNGISDTMVQSMVSTMFKQENNRGVDAYKAFSYRLCTSPAATNARFLEFESVPQRGISTVIDFMKIEFDNKPSQCSSASSYSEEDLFGVETRDRTYTYDQKLPVIGGDVVDMRVRYEVEQ